MGGFLGISVKKRVPGEYPHIHTQITHTQILEEQVLNNEVDMIWLWFQLENKPLQGYALAP